MTLLYASAHWMADGHILHASWCNETHHPPNYNQIILQHLSITDRLTLILLSSLHLHVLTHSLLLPSFSWISCMSKFCCRPRYCFFLLRVNTHTKYNLVKNKNINTTVCHSDIWLSVYLRQIHLIFYCIQCIWWIPQQFSICTSIEEVYICRRP